MKADGFLTVGLRSRPNQVPGDRFVAKIRIESWTLVWSMIVKPATPLGLTVGSDGSAFVTGYTDDATLFPASTGAFRSAALGSSPESTFVMKVNPAGFSVDYSALVAPHSPQSGAAIAVDALGRAYLAAMSPAGAAPVTQWAYLTESKACLNVAFVAKLSTDGKTLVFGSYSASATSPLSAVIAVDSKQVDSKQDVYVDGAADDVATTEGVVERKIGGVYVTGNTQGGHLHAAFSDYGRLALP